MWPDLEVDEDLALTDRLNNRIQMFHDLIGLDNRLLTDAERLNNADMYRIYEGGEMPDMGDGFDEASAAQRAQALLQRIQRESPELWREIIELPDGLRSALKARAIGGRNQRRAGQRPVCSSADGHTRGADADGCVCLP